MERQLTLYYTKHFLSGNLKDLNVPCAISFPQSSAAHYAKVFCKGHQGNDVITKSRYVIVDASFQNYQR